MCNFLSAVVLRNGDVLSHPLLDSHSDLVRYFELPDTSVHHQHFAKVELTPRGNWLDPETWDFRLDEATAPGWWDDVKGQAEATLRARAKAMILTTGRKALILDGCWILAGDAIVDDMRGGRIIRMHGGTLAAMRGGTLTAMYGGTLAEMYGGTLTTMYGGTLTAMHGGTLAEMHGGTLSKQVQEFLKAKGGAA
jgi:hypothetical protein